MLSELRQGLVTYQEKWQSFVHERTDAAFFGQLHPTNVGWKVADAAAFDGALTALREHSDVFQVVWLDGRWLATVHVRDNVRLPWDMRLVLLMQRRPQSTDVLGLDHVGFLLPKDHSTVETVLVKEEGVTWTNEKADYCSWISIWFADTEAKLRTTTIVSSSIAELKEVEGLD